MTGASFGPVKPCSTLRFCGFSGQLHCCAERSAATRRATIAAIRMPEGSRHRRGRRLAPGHRNVRKVSGALRARRGCSNLLPMFDLDREGARATLIAALLAATFALTAFLALRAQMASLYHRATAEKVVRDWSAFAADELLRRLENAVNYDGTYPVLQAIANEPSGGAAQRSGAPLVMHTFRCKLPGGPVVTSPGTPEETRAWLAANLPEAVRGERRPLVATINGRQHAFAY